MTLLYLLYRLLLQGLHLWLKHVAQPEGDTLSVTLPSGWRFAWVLNLFVVAFPKPYATDI